MSMRRQTGFTLIEVMLFLGITGLIMAFMLNGVGSQLNQRRYQDANNSLVSYLQGQYNLVANVNNSREQGAGFGACDTSGVAGTSECTVVGRILRSDSIGGDTQAITSAWVIARNDVALLKESDGADVVLQKADLAAASDVDKYDTGWGTKLVQAADHAEPLTFTALIVRVPTTGIIRTYINTDANRSLADIVTAGDNISGDFKFCLDHAGLLGTSTNIAGALIKKGTTNTSGVELVGQGSCI